MGQELLGVILASSRRGSSAHPEGTGLPGSAGARARLWGLRAVHGQCQGSPGLQDTGALRGCSRWVTAGLAEPGDRARLGDFHPPASSRGSVAAPRGPGRCRGGQDGGEGAEAGGSTPAVLGCPRTGPGAHCHFRSRRVAWSPSRSLWGGKRDRNRGHCFCQGKGTTRTWGQQQPEADSSHKIKVNMR